MAETNYDGLELIVRYDGTKANFEKITDKSAYYGKVVFIAGDSDGKDQAIWIHGTNTAGTASGKYLSMTNITEIESALSHVKGLRSKGVTYPASGGAILTLVGTTKSGDWTTDPLDITVKTDGTVTFDVSAIVGKINDISSKVNLQEQSINGHTATINTLVGSDSGKSVRAIAEEEAGEVKTDLTSDDTDTTQAKTIGGAKKYADAAAASKASAAKTEAIQESKNYVDPLLANKADLENGKIPVGQLPDYILGQMLFGGTLDGGTTSQMTVTPTANLLDKIGKTEADLNTEGKLVITNTSSETYEGVYFISSINFGNTNVVNIPDVRIGDWIISTGTNWRKVDNTDAVSSVAGLTGVITANALAQKLAETGDANELALKSEVDEKYSLPDGGIPETDLAGDVVEKINKGKTSVQSVSGGDFISVTDTSVTTNSKSYEVTAKTKTMEAAKNDILLNGEDALATAHDVYNFIKARLSVKVVS